MKRNKVLQFVSILGLLIVLISVFSCVPPEGTSEEGASQGGLGSYTMLIFIVLIFAVMYFVMIRPQRKRMKEQQDMMAKLKKGDSVVTASGIYGQIESVKEDSVVLKIESGATIRVSRSSVVGKQ